jgi:hypothetical protein
VWLKWQKAGLTSKKPWVEAPVMPN